MGATWRPRVNDSDAPANGEASNNMIEVVRNWRRCMDLELIGESQREAGRGVRSGLSDFIYIGHLRRSQPPRRSRASQMLRATLRLAAKSARRTRSTGCQLVKPRISDSTDNIFRSQSLEPSFCRPETEVTLQGPVPLRLRIL